MTTDTIRNTRASLLPGAETVARPVPCAGASSNVQQCELGSSSRCLVCNRTCRTGCESGLDPTHVTHRTHLTSLTYLTYLSCEFSPVYCTTPPTIV